jgi:hypothetical protein
MNDIQQAVDEFRAWQPGAEHRMASEYAQQRFGGDEQKIGEFVSLWRRLTMTDAEFRQMTEGSAGERGR